MRACLVAHRFYNANTHMMMFANALARRGDEVDVISLGSKGLPNPELVDGVNVYGIQNRTWYEGGPARYLLRNILFLLHAAVIVARNHVKRPYQVIHVVSPPEFLVFVATLPKLLGAAIILDLRDLVPELYASKFRVSDKSFIFKFLTASEKLSAALADHVIVANPVWYERVVKRSAPPRKTSMIWYYPDPKLFYPRPKHRTDRKFVIMYPGTLSWHQGVDVAVRAFPKILLEIPEAEFHIYGVGPLKQYLITLIEELEVCDKVKVLDGLPAKRIAEVMAESDLAIEPKRASIRFGNEAGSTKIWEFMALGVPVVASRTETQTRFFDDSAIQYFQSEDEEDLVRAVLSVYRNPELKRQLITNGTRYIQQGTWEGTMAPYLSVVDALVRPQNGAGRISNENSARNE